MIGNILIILSSTTIIYFIIALGISFYYKEIFSIPSVWFAITPLLSCMLMVNILTKTILRNQETCELIRNTSEPKKLFNLLLAIDD